MDSFFLDAATLSGNAGLAPSSPVGGQNLLLVDSSVTNYQYFVNSAANNAQVFLLNSQEDGVAQISAILASYTNIASLQIISHGDSGSLNLGNTTLKSWDNYTNDLAGWGKALSPDADILFFGCNVAQGEQGQRFVSELSTLTGADVAASDDLTGLGGDWVLEFATGSIETSMVFDPSTYDGTLNTLVTANQVANTISLYGANGSGGFGAPTTLAAGGTSPNTVALGDINGDGLLDIVSGNSGSGNISLFLNNGTGGFSAPQTFATNGNPTSLILADVNKDGRLDAIAQVRANNRFAVLLNNGMGGFSAQQSFTSGATPFGIAAIDVNSDGNLDIITSNSGNNTVTVNLGNGTGTFAAVGTSVAIGTSVQDMTVGDLNNDGRMDFVTANRGSRNVTVGLGNGTGGFSVANFTVSNTDRPNAVAVGDLNGDGFSDIAVALTGSTTTGNPLNTAVILLNSGTGSFGTATAVGPAASSQQNDILIRDINGDSFADLVISSPNGNQIALLTGNGTGGFTAQTPLATTAAPYGLAFGSFGGSTPPADTTAPVLQSATVNGSTVVLTYNETLDGVSDPAGSAYTVTVNGVQRTVNNVDANGTTVTLTLASAVSAGETVVLNYAVPATNPVQDVAGNDAIVLTNQAITNNTLPPADTTAPVLQSATVNGSTVVLTYNETLDGASDPAGSAYTVTVNGVQRTVNSANANGTTVTLTLASAVSAGETVVLNYAVPATNPVQDAAGNDAIVLTNQSVTNSTLPVTPNNGVSLVVTNSQSSTISLFNLNNNGTFSSPTILPVAGNRPFSVATGDVNRDGLTDIVTADRGSHTLSLFLNNGLGGFQSPQSIAVGTSPVHVLLQDINGDSFLDALTANRDSNNVSVLLGNGNGSFAPQVTYASGTGTSELALGDMNKDGFIDLLSVNLTSSDVTFRLGSSTGSFGVETTYAVGSRPESINIADLNNDGNLDFITGNPSSRNVSVYLGNGNGTFGTQQTYVAGSNPSPTALGDFNEDGYLDIVAGNASIDTISLLLNRGDGTFVAPVAFTIGLNPYDLVVRDLNGDGDLDIVSANANANSNLPGSISVLFGNGRGSFTRQPDLVTELFPTDLAFGSFSFTQAADTTPPVLQNSVVNGSNLILTYNETLDGTSDPAGSTYMVMVNGVQRAVNSVDANGTTVTLTLASAVAVGETVVLNYAVPATNPVQDVAGNDAIVLTNQAITNNTLPPADTTAPVLQSATVNGSTLVLTYNETLDGGSDPAGSAYTVTVNGVQRTVNSVDANGTTVTLTLASAVAAGETVLLNYAVPATNPVQDVAGNDAIVLTNQAITNNTLPPADTTAPVLQSATVNGTTVTLTYNETLDGASDPTGSAYTVTVNGVQRTINNVDANGTTVTLTLASAVSAGETVVLNYAVPATNPVQDVAGNDAIVLTNQSVTNNTPSTGGTDTTAPVLVNAVVTGHLLTSGVKLIYNERLDGAADPNPNNYTVLVNGVARGVTGVNVQPGIGAEGTTVLLTLSSQVLQGDVVTVSYTPGSIAVQDIAGNDAASFTNLNVANLRNFALDYSFMRVRDVFDFTQFGYTYDRGYVTGFNTLPTTATQRTGLATRKNAIDMTPEEIDAYINAILTLKETTVLSPNGIEISIYDQMVAAHIATGDAGGRQAPDGTTMANPAHGGPGFMPWHRLLLAEYEDALQAVNPTVTLPYWDWTNVNGTINTVLQDNFMGSGTGGTISSGYFSLANGWAVRNDLSDGRWLGVDATPESFGRNLGLRVQNPGTWATNLTSILASSAFTPFANGVERGTGAHNNAHGYIGGIMSNVAASPNDPIFWMLHSNVDRLWAEWQVNNHWGTGFYAADGQNYGHDLDDPLFLWDNGAIPIAADLRDILPRGINGSPGNIINGNTTVTGSVTNTGVVTPGNSPGTVIIEGDYTQSSEGKLTIEIAGLEQGHQYDFLKVDGTASLDGTLNLYFPGDFDPSHQTFVFLSAANIEGDFSEINVFGLDTPLEYSLYKSADNTSYTLEFFGAADTSTTNYGIAQTRADLFEDTDLSLYNPFFGQGIDMYIYGLGHHHGWGFDGEDAIVDHAPSTTDWYLSYDVNVNEWIATLEQGGSVPDEYRSPDAHDHGGDHGTGGGTTDDHECCEECDHGTDSGMTDDHTHHDHDHGTDGGTANGGTANDHDHEHCDDHGTDGTTDDHTHHDHDHDHGTDGGTANGGTTNDHDHEHCDDHGSDGGMTDDHTHHDHDHDHDHGTDSGTTDDHAHHDHDHHDHGTGDTTSSPTPETIAPSPVPSETPSSIPSLGVFTVGSTGQVIFDFLADCGAYQGELAIFNLSAVANLVPGSAEFIAAAARSAQVIFGTEAGARFRGNLGETSQAHGSYNGQKVFTFTPGDQLVLMLVPNGTLADVLAGEVRPLFSVAAANPDAKEHLGLLISTHDNSVTLGWEDLSTEQGSDFDFNDFVFHIHGVGGQASDLAQLVAGNRAWLNTQFAQELIAFCKNNECVDPGTVGDAHDHSTHDHSDHNHADSEQSIASESSELDTTADHSHSHGDTTEAAVTDSSTSTEPHTTDSGHSEDCHTDESVDSADLSDSHGDSHSDLTMVTLPTSDPHAEDTIVPLPGAHPEDCEEHSTQETALAEVLPEVPDSSSSAHEIGVILNGQDTNLEETEDCECCAETTEALPEEQTSEATEEHDHAHHHHE